MRLPWLLKSVLVPAHVVGLALALAGALWLLWRRRDQAALLLTGAVVVFAFALNYAVNDTPVFLVPTILVLWLAAAVGGEWIAGAWRSRIVAPLVAVVCCALPVWLVATNFREEDRSRDITADVQLGRLIEALPEPAALVKEDFLVDRMVTSKLLGDGPGHGRHIPLTAPHVAAVRGQMDLGMRVFAFAKSATRLRLEGAEVSFAPVRLLEGPLDRFLDGLPDDVIVALGVPAAQSAAFAASRGASLLAIGGPSTLAGIAPASIACVGARNGRVPLLQTGRLGVSVTAAAREPVGGGRSRPPGDIPVRADATEASVRLGSREVVRTQGAVLAARSQTAHGGGVRAGDRRRLQCRWRHLSRAYPLGELLTRRQWITAGLICPAAFDSDAIVHAAGQNGSSLFGDDNAFAPRTSSRPPAARASSPREDRPSADDEPGVERCRPAARSVSVPVRGRGRRRSGRGGRRHRRRAGARLCAPYGRQREGDRRRCPREHTRVAPLAGSPFAGAADGTRRAGAAHRRRLVSCRLGRGRPPPLDDRIRGPCDAACDERASHPRACRRCVTIAARRPPWRFAVNGARCPRALPAAAGISTSGSAGRCPREGHERGLYLIDRLTKPVGRVGGRGVASSPCAADSRPG